MIIMKRISIVVLVGFCMTVLGGILSFCWNGIFTYFSDKKLTPTSSIFQLWKSMPINIGLSVHFFNWTNPEEIFDVGFKPKFVDVGPYRFNERFEKVNITWNKNGTISFRNRRYWYFDPENSVGTLDDSITTLNPVPVAAAYASRHYMYLFQLAVSSSMRISRQNISITKTVGEFMFSGYPDRLLTIASSLPFVNMNGFTGNKFAWFQNRNGTSEYEGIFNMETGEEDSARTGTIREWNYKNRTDMYPGECGMINGSDGVLFHPDLRRDESIVTFSSEFCRSITLDYSEDVVMDGVLGYRYVGTEMLVDNGKLDPKNWCNCNGECLPYGTVNISACHFGAPAFASYPHFLYAHPSYLQQVDGLQPNKSEHGMFIILEPKTGIPMEAVARAQLNFLLQPYENIGLFYNVPKIVFPMLWLEKSARLPPHLMLVLRLLVGIPENGMYLSMCLMILGFTMLAAALGSTYARNWKNNRAKTSKSYDVLQAIQKENTNGSNEEFTLLKITEQGNNLK